MCVGNNDIENSFCCNFMKYLGWAREGKAEGADWLFLVLDKFDYTYYPVCIKEIDKSVAYTKALKKINTCGDMQQIRSWIRLNRKAIKESR